MTDATGDGRPPSDARIVVVGGGLGGIAAALQLRAKGHAVVLVERNERLGGIAAGFEENGVRGFYPLAFGDYAAFDSLFDLHGRKAADYVDVIHLNDMQTRFIADDGTSLQLGDLESSLASLKQRSEELAAQYQRLYDRSKQQFERMGGDATGIFADVVAEHVEDELVRMAIDYRCSLLGENPYTTSSFYIMMLHMQEMWGSFTAPGGVGGLVEPLERLMRDVGIEVVEGDAVARLECAGARVEKAVLESGRELPCSHVISDVAPRDLYGRLLSEEWGSTGRALLGDVKYSPSVFSYHFTTRRTHPELPPMIVLFPRDLERFCSQVYDEGVMPDELLLGVYRASAHDRSFSPEGGDHFGVYLSVPNLRADIRWETVSPGLVEAIVARLEAYLLPGLSEDLVAGFHRTPLDMAAECALPYGAGFGRQVTRVELGKEFFPGQDPDLGNLYLVGHNTMPGPGLNAVLMSAQFAAARIPAAT